MKSTTFHVYTIVTVFIIFVSIIFLAQNEVSIPYWRWQQEQNSQDGSNNMKTMTTFHQVAILENMSYTNDNSWSSTLMPQGQGLLQIRHNETFNLSMGISMFHALHCLGLLRRMLQQTYSDGETQSHGHGNGGHSSSNKTDRFLHERHMPHCISYIAQSIMCAGDDTIETPWLEKDSNGNIVKQGIDGNGVEHQCKDTSLLWKVAKKSEHISLDPWVWTAGDTISSIFADKD